MVPKVTGRGKQRVLIGHHPSLTHTVKPPPEASFATFAKEDEESVDEHVQILCLGADPDTEH